MSFMKIGISEFLSKRELSKPDGRALYAYRAKEEELEQLAFLLSKSLVERAGSVIWKNGAERAFVIYASEWWRRNYDGGPWRWEDVFKSLGWPELTPSNRQLLVESGIKFWKRGVNQNSSGHNAYLMTLVTEGGFPVKMVERSSSHLKTYLKSVLSDYSIYCSAGMSVTRIAESCAGRLPAAFRKPAVYQLAAELVVALYELSEHTQNTTNPFETLNREHKGWQDTLPISLESNAAQGLVNSLLKTASSRRNTRYEKLTLTRYFEENFDGNLKHKSKISLPSSMTVELLANELGISEQNLPRRLEMAVYVDGKIIKVASLSKEDEEYYVYAYSPESLYLDIKASSSVSAIIMEYGGARLSNNDLTIVGGSGLEEDIPMACYKEGEQFIVVGQGGLRSRLEHLYVSLPPGLEIIDEDNSLEILDYKTVGFHEGGRWVKIEKPLTVDLQQGFKCTIIPGDIADNSGGYIVSGYREYLFDGGKKVPVFKGLPKFYKNIDGPLRQVSIENVFWAYSGSADWLACSDNLPLGTIRLRIVDSGQCVFSSRLTILPEEFHLTLEPGNDSRSGNVIIEGLADAVFATEEGIPIKLSTEVENNTSTISCETSVGFSGKIPLHIYWKNGAKCQLMVPFPGQGTQFVDVNGADIGARVISLSSLVGVSAVGITPNSQQHFSLQGELRAKDIGGKINKSTFGFVKKLDQVSMGYSEFRLVDLYTQIRELFSYSADLDARVSLEILQGAITTSRLDITQFDSELSFDPKTLQISHIDPNSQIENEQLDVNFIPMASDDTLEVDTKILTDDGNLGWQINEVPPGSAFLAVGAGSAIRSIRPCIVFSLENNDEAGNDENLQLDEMFVLSSGTERREALKQLMVALSENPLDSRWASVLTNVRKFAEVHPDSLDLYEAIIDNSTVAAGILIRSVEQDLPALLDWEDYLPFRWWQVPINSFVKAYKGYAAYIEKEYPDYKEIMLKAACDQLKKLNSLIPQTEVIVNAALFESVESVPEGILAQAEVIGAAKLFEAINATLINELLQQAGDSEWPHGICRDEWELRFGSSLPWLDHRNMGYRKPFVDAVVASAYSTVMGEYLEREERAFICVMRAFNLHQFDRMIKLTEAAFYQTIRNQ